MSKPKDPTRNTNPLHDLEADHVARILADIWEVPRGVKAALALQKAGFTSHDLWRYGKTKQAQMQPDEWRGNTYNDLKDMEITKHLKNNPPF